MFIIILICLSMIIKNQSIRAFASPLRSKQQNQKTGHLGVSVSQFLFSTVIFRCFLLFTVAPIPMLRMSYSEPCMYARAQPTLLKKRLEVPVGACMLSPNSYSPDKLIKDTTEGSMLALFPRYFTFIIN